MQLFAGRRLWRGLTGYIAAENLLNQRYATALSPPTSSNPSITTLGPPILARVGLRYEFPSTQN
jgi:outer membrane receptor protein involved in Fe transport